MITKERIDELIQQRAKVWGVGKQGNVFCVGLKFRPETLKSPKWLENKYEHYGKFFETKAEAEWHAEFGSIERTERLEFPTWEELQNEVGNGWKRLFIGFDEEKQPMQFMLGVIPDDKIYIGFTKEIGAKVFDIEFEALTTKENYTLACRKCKELFLNGNVND